MALDLDQAIAQAADESGRANVVSAELWTVKSADTHTVTVVNSTQTLSFPYLRSYRLANLSEPVAGDVVLVLRAGSAGWIVGAFGPQPSKPTPPKPPDPHPPISGSNTFLPGWTGTYRGGWRGDTSDLYQGDWTGRGVNTGAAYYQGAVTGLAGATISALSVHLTRGSGGTDAAQAPTLVLLGNAGTTAPPQILASHEAPSLRIGQSGDQALPGDWAAQLLSGAADGIGICVNGSQPYVQVLGRNNDAASMALRVDWTRPA